VLPDGTLLADGNDVVLHPAPVAGSTLAQLLRPAGGQLPVAASTVEAIIASIGFERDDVPFTVDRDGGFAFGPARGRFSKGRCEFIGAAARAETRRRRITALEEELAQLKERAVPFEATLRALKAAADRLEQERSSLPSGAACRRAFGSLQKAQRTEESLRSALDRANEALAKAEREQRHAADALQRHCDRHRLDPYASAEQLSGVETRVDDYAALAPDLKAAERTRAEALALTEERSEDVAAAVLRVEQAADAVSDAEQRATEASGRLEALAIAGQGAERALARLKELDGELKTLTNLRKQRAGEKEEAIRTTALRRAEAKSGREQRDRRAVQLADALSDVRALASADLLPLALERAGNSPAKEEALAWDAHRWDEYLDRLPASALSSRGSREHLANELDRSYEILQQEIDAAQLQIARERRDGLVVVRPRMDGEERSFASLVDELTEQVTESELRLSEQDRRLFEDFVTGGLVEHLRTRIAEAYLSVQKMKDEIAKVEASSGMAIGIGWRRRDDESAVLKRALELLRIAPARLSDDERLALSEFIRGQIAEVRVTAKEGETTIRQLERALDYRAWHRFEMTKSNRKRGIAAHVMTRHAHESGSGGEKAIALHLPLLAAAASYPASARADALRIVILDEAFTRIDDAGRRGLMTMMVAFGLDLVLTAPDFWGCYGEVPGLSIYQLAPSDPNDPGVVARRFIWNGETRREVDEDEQLTAFAA
jgi:hypothetical protein